MTTAQTRRSEWINSARRSSSALLVFLIGCASGSDPAAPPPPATPAAATDTVRTTDLAPGVRHTYRWEKAGPWAIHVVEVDLTRCGVALKTINGDYFSFTPAGYPVGSQVVEGEPLRGYTRCVA